MPFRKPGIFDSPNVKLTQQHAAVQLVGPFCGAEFETMEGNLERALYDELAHGNHTQTLSKARLFNSS